jgi:DNA-binding transcriptional LysR family regulator
MTLEALTFFHDAVLLKSFSKAAERHKVTQSTVSQAIQQVEKYFDAALINRTVKPWQLTKNGDVCFRSVEEILHKIDITKELIQDSGKEEKTVLGIASIYSVGLSYMNHFIKGFNLENDKVQVNLEYLHPEKVYQSVVMEETDLGIMSYAKADKLIDVIPWCRELMVVVCSADHELAKQKEINIADINGLDYVHFDRQLKIRDEIDTVFEKNSISVNTKLEFDNIESMKRAVEANAGVSLLPLTTVKKELEAGSLHVLQLKDIEVYRPLGIIHKKNLKECAKGFIKLLKSDRKIFNSKYSREVVYV